MTVLASVRESSLDFPLFLHVLGAILLFGAVMSSAVLDYASLRRALPTAALLRRLAFRTTLIVVWPSYIVMRVGAEWIRSKEFPNGAPEPDWVGVGYMTADLGVLVLAALTVCAWLASRQTSEDRPKPATATIAVVIAVVFLLALAVAWFAMTAKPGS